MGKGFLTACPVDGNSPWHTLLCPGCPLIPAVPVGLLWPLLGCFPTSHGAGRATSLSPASLAPSVSSLHKFWEGNHLLELGILLSFFPEVGGEGIIQVIWFLMLFHLFVYFITSICRRGVPIGETRMITMSSTRTVPKGDSLTCNAGRLY